MDLRQEAGQDGRQSGDMVQTDAGRKVAEEFGAEYFECSAKTGCMVEEAFTATATKVRTMSHQLGGVMLRVMLFQAFRSSLPLVIQTHSVCFNAPFNTS